MKTSLVIVQSLYGGGAEKQIRLLLPKFETSRPHVLFLGEPSERCTRYLESIGVDSDYIRTKSALLSMISIFRVIKRRDPAFVFSGVLNINFVTAILNLLDFSPKRKYIIRESGMLSQYQHGLLDTLVKLVYRIAYPRLSIVLVQSEFHRKDCSGYFDIKNVVVLPNLVQDDSPPSTKQRPILEVSSHSLNLVWIGRFSYEKDPLLAIQIVKHLVLLKVKCTLRMYGDGELKRDVEAAVKAEGLTKYVVFEGFVDNPFSGCATSDILLITSIQDTYPNTILEAEAFPMMTVSVEHYGSIYEMAKLSPNIILAPRHPKLAAVLMQERLNGCTAFYPSKLLELHAGAVAASVLRGVI